MANYSQIFTLKDIFTNKSLKNKIPIINYREIQREDGKVSVRTSMKNVLNLAYDTSVATARPYYKPLNAQKFDKIISIGGTLVGNQESCVNAIFNALIGKRQIIAWTANNGQMIRDALKEAEKNRRQYGINSKLYLKVQSAQQIAGMNKFEINNLLNDVIENIIYGDDFPKTQRKYNVEEMKVAGRYNYEQRKERWKRKIGE